MGLGIGIGISPSFGTPAVSFTPASISGLELELRSDTDTFQDAALSTAAASDGDPVGGWGGQVQSRDATQSTTAKKPTWKANIFGTKPGIRFDVTDDVLEVADANAFTPGGDGFTVFLLTKNMQTSGSSFGLFGKGDADHNQANAEYSADYNVTNTRLRWFIADQGTARIGRQDSAFADYADRKVLTFVYDGGTAASGIDLLEDGTEIDDADSGVTGTFVEVANGTLPLLIGATIIGTTAMPSGADYGYVLVYSRALTAAEQAKVVAYLGEY